MNLHDIVRVVPDDEAFVYLDGKKVFDFKELKVGEEYRFYLITSEEDLEESPCMLSELIEYAEDVSKKVTGLDLFETTLYDENSEKKICYIVYLSGSPSFNLTT